MRFVSAKQVIGVNPARYTAWEWRWRCLTALGLPPSSDAPFLRCAMTANPKNYQLWNYRRRIALAIGLHRAAKACFDFQSQWWAGILSKCGY